ncbi:MAG: hypothetical protein JWQ38_508 [Flavipsychrobacter sp.]|nr:hypothetical protein [Flavipsychrobacter sp.]
MKNLLIIALSLITVLISNYLGATVPPFSILFTPVIIGCISCAILIYSTWRLTWRVLIVVGIIILNDLLIRLYAGGNHDGEGNEWISIFMLIGAVVAFIFAVAAVINNTSKTKAPEKIIAVLLFPFILYPYQSYFSSFGMASINNNYHNINASKSNGVFIASINFPDSELVYANDTFILQSGWIERQTTTHYLTLVKKTLPTNNYNYIIPIKGKFDQYGWNDKIFIQINQRDMNGASPIQDVLIFHVDTAVKDVTIYFSVADSNGLNIIKTVEVNK